jgi:hypothetical protein
LEGHREARGGAGFGRIAGGEPEMKKEEKRKKKKETPDKSAKLATWDERGRKPGYGPLCAPQWAP